MAMNSILRIFNRSGIFLIILILTESSCHSQNNNHEKMPLTNQDLKTREAAVAGQFYPASPNELQKELEMLFTGGPHQKISGSVLAILAPHAGYIFSGGVAAESYEQLDRDMKYDNIFVIGSSHHYMFDGASIYTQGNFKTPLGVVPVNIDLARELCKRYTCFTTRTDAQLNEHCVEVQLPFLQYWLHKPFRIIPIVLGTQYISTCRNIAEALKPYFNESNLFVISTDFAHYPAYQDAVTNDHRTAEAILTNNPDRLKQVLESNENSGIQGLATSLCGWTSVMTLLYMTSGTPALHYDLIDYKNSGDAPGVGDKSRVVGYCAIAVSDQHPATKEPESEPSFQLSETDRQDLLNIARQTIESYTSGGKMPAVQTDHLSPSLLADAGAFVSLYKDGNLRGCIGRFNPNEALFKVVQEMAVAASSQDSRFSPVTADELPQIRIEISVLTPLKKISSTNEIVLGKHGIYMRKGSFTGTFLPQVATSTGWTLDEFLGHCSRDKAGMGWDGWKTAELYTYEAIVFKEK
jgi:MEMO1 family protein